MTSSIQRRQSSRVLRALPSRGPALALALIVGAAGCATPQWKRPLHDRYFQHAPAPRLHSEPEERSPSSWWESGWQSLRPLGEVLSPGRHLRRATGGAPALDVNAFGQVPDSTWFENRINRREMTAAQMRRGPNTIDGPAPGPLTVLSGKIEGITPGMVARDARGVRWVIKFDPPAFPEMASGAEIVATKLMYAAGYHVPENYLVTFDLTDLELSPAAKTVDDYNRKVPFDRRRLVELVAQLNPDPVGRVRALFSRFLPGTPVGPFAFIGTRPDDPNDTIPHDRRRSLRALWVFAAWLNNTDTTQIDTFDTFIRANPRAKTGYVRHYLLDFNASMGSDATWPKPMIAGFAYLIDWLYVAERTAALGFYYPYWLTARPSPFRAVGPFESQVFDPAGWRPSYPNPAFQQATARDSYWAASILTYFSPALIRAAVQTGQFSEPGATRWVEQIMLERRNKLLRHAFEPVLPLDRPRVDAQNRLRMENLAVTGGVLSRHEVRYHVRVRHNRTGAADREIYASSVDDPVLPLDPIVKRARAAGGTDFARDPFVTVTWRREDGAKPQGPRVEVHLRIDQKRAIALGLAREVD